MKTPIAILFLILGGAIAPGMQFDAPELTKLNNTYTHGGFTFSVLISKDKALSLDAVGIVYNDKKVSVPLRELENIGWPRLDQIEVRKELDIIYVSIPYGQELPEIKGHLTKVCYQFKKNVYFGRERIVPTKQVVTEEQITTDFQYFFRVIGEDERPSGAGSIVAQRKR